MHPRFLLQQVSVITSYSIHYTKLYEPAPQEVLDDPDFKKTSKTIVKQIVGIRLLLDVTEYRADVYYNARITSYNVCYTKLLRRKCWIIYGKRR